MVRAGGNSTEMKAVSGCPGPAGTETETAFGLVPRQMGEKSQGKIQGGRGAGAT